MAPGVGVDCDANEIDLSSSDEEEEEGRASSLAEESDSSRSVARPSRKRVRRDDDDGAGVSSARGERSSDGAEFDIDVTRPYFLTLGTGCASPSPLRGEFGVCHGWERCTTER